MDERRPTRLHIALQRAMHELKCIQQILNKQEVPQVRCSPPKNNLLPSTDRAAAAATGVEIITRLAAAPSSSSSSTFLSDTATAQQDQVPAVGFSHFSNVLFGTEDSRTQDDFLQSAQPPPPLQQQPSGLASAEASSSFWGPYVAAEDDELPTPNPKGPLHSGAAAYVAYAMPPPRVEAAAPLDGTQHHHPAGPVSLHRHQTPSLEDDDMCALSGDENADGAGAGAGAPLPSPMPCSSPVPVKTGKRLFSSTADGAGRQRRGSHRGEPLAMVLRASSEPPISGVGHGGIPTPRTSSSSGALLRSLSVTGSKNGSVDGGSAGGGSKAARRGGSSGAAAGGATGTSLMSLRSSLDSSVPARRLSSSGGGGGVAFGSSVPIRSSADYQQQQQHSGPCFASSKAPSANLSRTSLPLGPSTSHNISSHGRTSTASKTAAGGHNGKAGAAFGGNATASKPSSGNGGPLCVSLSIGHGGASPLCGSPRSAKLKARAFAVSASENLPLGRLAGLR